MLYAWIGFLKPGSESIPPSLQESATDFLSQPAADQDTGRRPPPRPIRQARGDDADLRARQP